MKNFKLFALVLCLVMLVSSAAMADMTPGTYTGVATGMFDGLTVEVTVSATAIEDRSRLARAGKAARCHRCGSVHRR